MRKSHIEFIFSDEIFEDKILENLFIKSKIPLGKKVRITLEELRK